MTDAVPEKRLRRPSGDVAPGEIRVAGGELVRTEPLAGEITARFFALHPEQLERYGAAARDWCLHDSRWIVAWTLMDTELRAASLVREVDWLAGVLDARGYPLDGLADCLRIAGEVLSAQDATWSERAAGRLLTAARRVGERGGSSDYT
jgi:hypothetical protein